MEVHVPEHPIHTWKEFLIHMGTICLGLVIALGLEQFAEFLHHRHQLHTLREALHEEDEKALRDSISMIRTMQVRIDRVDARMAQVDEALQHNVTITPQPKGGSAASIPVDAAWEAARASNLIDVMPQDDIVAYSEIQFLVDHIEKLSLDNTASENVAALERQYRAGRSAAPDLSSASRQELMEYLRVLQHFRTEQVILQQTTLYLQGALEAVLRGERNPDSIDANELKVEQGYRVP